MVNHVNNNHQG